MNFLTAKEQAKVFPEKKNQAAKFNNKHRKTHSLLAQPDNQKQLLHTLEQSYKTVDKVESNSTSKRSFR